MKSQEISALYELHRRDLTTWEIARLYASNPMPVSFSLGFRDPVDWFQAFHPIVLIPVIACPTDQAFGDFTDIGGSFELTKLRVTPADTV